MAHLNDFRPELTSQVHSFTRNIFSDEKTEQKIRKHLSDINDLITDEDLINIKTEMTVATESQFEESAKKEGFSKEETAI